MNRKTSLALRLLGLSMFGALAAALVMGGPLTSKSEMAGWRLLDPVSYENLTIFPVVTNHAAETSGFVTLDEALASGDATVTERGSDTIHRTRDGRPDAQQYQSNNASVNQLVLINRGKKPLILLAGELVSGGKQDRIIAKDRIVPVGAEPLPLDVFCVEHGRWSNGDNFKAGNVMVHPSVREKAVVEQQQSEVWNSVRNGSSATARGSAGNGGTGSGSGSNSSSGSVHPVAPAPPRLSQDTIGSSFDTTNTTGSYQKTYESPVVNNVTDPFIDEIQKRFTLATKDLKGEQVIGVVIAYGGEVAWSDIFASPELFQRYWTKLLRSYVVEAVARPGTKEHASLADAQEFLRPLEGPEKVESLPGAYRWREVTQGHYAEIELQSIKPMDLLLHRLKIHRTT